MMLPCAEFNRNLVLRVASTLSALLLLALAACSDNDVEDGQFEAADQAAESAIGAFERRAALAPAGVQIVSGSFLGTETEPRRTLEELPPALHLHDAVVLNSNEALTLDDIARRLSRITGIHHRVTGNGGPLAEAARSQLSLAGSQTLIPDLRGSLPEVLDSVATTFDVSWYLRSGQIELWRQEYRLYQIHALPKSSSASTSIGAFTSSASLDIATEINSAIADAAGSAAQFHFGQGTGLLAVTASPSVHEKIARQVERINASLGQQIAFDVSLLTVSLRQASGFGANLHLLVEGSDGKSIDFSSTQSLATPTDTVNIGIMAGSYDLRALVSTLQDQGKVSVETRTGATTSNNRIVPIQVIREVAYARNVEVTTDAHGNAKTTINPGKFTTGFEMYLFPRVINNLEVLLNFSVRISELDNLTDFTADRQAIQLPSISTTVFEQQSILGNGETLVLAGFERDRVVSDRDSSWFGGERSRRASERVATVLLVRPRILLRKT